MTRSAWQRPWVRTATTLLTIAVMVMIFCFSMENAEISDQRSSVFSEPIIRIFHPEYDSLEKDARQVIYDRVQHIVRKCAHFSEYLILGFLIRLCLESLFGHRMKRYRNLATISLSAGFGYACSDEAHQLAIDGRSGQWSDILVDSSGVLAGVMLGTMLIKTLNRKTDSQSQTEEVINGR